MSMNAVQSVSTKSLNGNDPIAYARDSNEAKIGGVSYSLERVPCSNLKKSQPHPDSFLIPKLVPFPNIVNNGKPVIL
jgi:hypothetical protein